MNEKLLKRIILEEILKTLKEEKSSRQINEINPYHVAAAAGHRANQKKDDKPSSRREPYKNKYDKKADDLNDRLHGTISSDASREEKVKKLDALIKDCEEFLKELESLSSAEKDSKKRPGWFDHQETPDRAKDRVKSTIKYSKEKKEFYEMQIKRGKTFGGKVKNFVDTVKGRRE